MKRERRMASEPARLDPEAFLPRAAWWNRLQLLVDAFLGEIQRVGDPRHGLETNVVRIGRLRAASGAGWRGRRGGRLGLSGGLQTPVRFIAALAFAQRI